MAGERQETLPLPRRSVHNVMKRNPEEREWGARSFD